MYFVAKLEKDEDIEFEFSGQHYIKFALFFVLDKKPAHGSGYRDHLEEKRKSCNREVLVENYLFYATSSRKEHLHCYVQNIWFKKIIEMKTGVKVIGHQIVEVTKKTVEKR